MAYKDITEQRNKENLEMMWTAWQESCIERNKTATEKTTSDLTAQNELNTTEPA